MLSRGPLLMILLVVTLLPLTCPGQVAEPDTDSVGVRRALLIGINEYQSKSLVNLRGAINDIETMRSLLTRKF